MMNRAPLSEYERANAKELFVLSARYEYQFWDMAWKLAVGLAVSRVTP